MLPKTFRNSRPTAQRFGSQPSVRQTQIQPFHLQASSAALMLTTSRQTGTNSAIPAIQRSADGPPPSVRPPYNTPTQPQLHTQLLFFSGMNAQAGAAGCTGRMRRSKPQVILSAWAVGREGALRPPVAEQAPSV